MSAATLDPRTALRMVDRMDTTLQRLRFVTDLLSAWDVESIPLSYDNLSGLGLFVDDILTYLESYQEQVSTLLVEQVSVRD